MKPALTATVLALALALAPGCSTELTLHDGASALFVHRNVCPKARVTVTPRPDLAPHLVLPAAPMQQPPAAIANDPERVRLWHSQQPHQPDLDAIGTTYEVSGCNTTTLYVCAHPRDDGGDSPWSAHIDNDLNITLFTDDHADDPDLSAMKDHVVTSSVVCLPGALPKR